MLYEKIAAGLIASVGTETQVKVLTLQLAES